MRWGCSGKLQHTLHPEQLKKTCEPKLDPSPHPSVPTAGRPLHTELQELGALTHPRAQLLRTVRPPGRGTDREGKLTAQTDLLCELSLACLCWLKARTKSPALSQTPTIETHRKALGHRVQSHPPFRRKTSSCVEALCPDADRGRSETEES